MSEVPLDTPDSARPKHGHSMGVGVSYEQGTPVLRDHARQLRAGKEAATPYNLHSVP